MRRPALMVSALVALLLAGAVRAQVAIVSPPDSSVACRDRMAVIVRGLPGATVRLVVNGQPVQELTVRPDLMADFLNVPMPTGPVAIAVFQASATTGASADSVHIHVVGAAARIELRIDPAVLPADSLSRAQVEVRVDDDWGMPLPDGQLVTAQLDAGQILAEDLYPGEAGVQIQVRQGRAVFHVLAPGSLGQGRLVVAADGVSAAGELTYVQPAEQWTVVGMASGQVGWRQAREAPAGVDAPASYRGGRYADGRAAVYARGTLADGYLLTGSYDSDRKYDDRVFRFLTPERLYPVYGDASSVFYEAPSSSPLYARVSKGQSHVTYGDFTTRLGDDAEVATYQRSLTGISSHLDRGRGRADLFAASTDQTIRVDELRGEGVSGYYYLTAARQGVPIIEGSERIVLQVRSRLHPEQVIREDLQYRFTDYEIDYEGGTVLFKRPVASLTSEEEPVYIVVTYETVRSLERHWTGGGSVAVTPVERVRLGATLVGEQRPDHDYWLTGLATRLDPWQGATLTAEGARSTAAESGWAWKVGADGRLGEQLTYEVAVRDADRRFDNPASPMVRPGVRKIRGRVAWSPTRDLELLWDSHKLSDAVNGEERTSTAMASTWRWRFLTNQVSVERTHAERSGRTWRSSTLSAGTRWAVSRRLECGISRDQTFGDEDLSYRPTVTRLQARWELNRRLDLVAEHAFRDGALLDSSFTAVALQSRLAEDLTAYANYQVDGGISGRQNQAIVGLRHQLTPGADLTLHTAFERVWSLRQPQAGSFWAYSLAAEYLPARRLKASARLEQRRGSSLNKTVATAAADAGLGRDLFLLGKSTYSGETHRQGETSGGLRTHKLAAGLAFRPSRHDRLNGLAKYERRDERNSLVSPHTERTTELGSVEAIVELHPRLEWFGRYGVKVSRLDSRGLASRTWTDLWMTNLRGEWRRGCDALVEYRLLRQRQAGDCRHGAAAEIGHTVAGDARLAAGYNFAGYHDGDFAGQSYWARGPYLKIQVKFTEAAVAAWLDGLQTARR